MGTSPMDTSEGTMKNTSDFLDALRVKLDLPSDNALGKYLGIHRQTISHYRTLNGSFDDEMSIRVAEILEIESAFVMACMHHQRAKNPKVKAVWEWTAHHLGGLAAALAVLAIIPFAPDIMPALPFGSEGAPLLGFAGFTEAAGIYIMRISG